MQPVTITNIGSQYIMPNNTPICFTYTYINTLLTDMGAEQRDEYGRNIINNIHPNRIYKIPVPFSRMPTHKKISPRQLPHLGSVFGQSPSGNNLTVRQANKESKPSSQEADQSPLG
jgi:hypothetical protein